MIKMSIIFEIEELVYEVLKHLKTKHKMIICTTSKLFLKQCNLRPFKINLGLSVYTNDFVKFSIFKMIGRFTYALSQFIDEKYVLLIDEHMKISFLMTKDYLYFVKCDKRHILEMPFLNPVKTSIHYGGGSSRMDVWYSEYKGSTITINRFY